jgi:hypothetical protein
MTTRVSSSDQDQDKREVHGASKPAAGAAQTSQSARVPSPPPPAVPVHHAARASFRLSSLATSGGCIIPPPARVQVARPPGMIDRHPGGRVADRRQFAAGEVGSN